MAVLITDETQKIDASEAKPSVPLDEVPAAPTEGEPPSPTMGERFRLFALAVLTFFCFVLCFLIAVPFLSAMAWGAALAIIAWPMHRWLESRIGQRTLSALLSTTVVTAAIAGTALFVGYQLAEEGSSVAEQLTSAPSAERPNETRAAAQAPKQASEERVLKAIEKVPGLNPLAGWLERLGIKPGEAIREFLATSTRDFRAVANGSVAALIQFMAAVFLLFFLFRDRRFFLEGLVSLLPLTRTESDRVFTRAADSVYANNYATFLTSLMTTAGIGMMFWQLGLPSPMLWTVVMFFLALLPVIGAGLVWVPAAIYLVVEGRWAAGAILVGWALLFFVLVDTILYARLAGPRMRMHETLTLLAFFGGLAYFGVTGMILGPAILAITGALMEVWKHRLTGVAPAPAIVRPSQSALEPG